MALMSGVIHDLVSTSRAMSAVDGIVIHTIVGFWSGGKAAHWTTDAAGTVRQHRDTTRQSAANLDGNPRWLAIENEDHGPAYGAWNTRDGHAVPAFTPAQCEAIAHILAFVHRAHGVPLELVPDTKPGRRGIAYHRQGIEGNYSGYAYGGWVPGGVRFSNQTGKVCPGDRRIAQLISVIIPRARVLAGLQQEDDMVDWDTKYKFHRTGLTTEFSNWIGETNAAANNAARDAAVVRTQLAALTQTLSDDEANLLAASKRIEDAVAAADQVVTPEQLEHLAEAIAAKLPPELVDAFDDKLRAAFTRAGQETTS